VGVNCFESGLAGGEGVVNLEGIKRGCVLGDDCLFQQALGAGETGVREVGVVGVRRVSHLS